MKKQIPYLIYDKAIEIFGIINNIDLTAKTTANLVIAQNIDKLLPFIQYYNEATAKMNEQDKKEFGKKPITIEWSKITKTEHLATFNMYQILKLNGFIFDINIENLIADEEKAALLKIKQA